MNRLCLSMGLAALSTGAFAATTVTVGDYTLQPDTAGQQIQIFVSGGDQVAGLNLSAMIGQFGESAPLITSADVITGTIFATNNAGQTTTILDPIQFRDAYVVTNSGTVSADGLLATLTVDTTGFSNGAWDLSLFDIDIPDFGTVTTDFGGDLVDTYANGSILIAVPEPAVMGVMAVSCVALWQRRRRTMA